jgi:predicted ATP-dependent protease
MITVIYGNIIYLEVKITAELWWRVVPTSEYSGVTLRKKVADRLKIIAVETNRTVPEVIEHMLDMQYPDSPDHAPIYLVAEER